MSFWWLQEGWTDALCGNCGANIWNSGGDPDWGLCWPCMQARHPEPEQQPMRAATTEDSDHERDQG